MILLNELDLDKSFNKLKHSLNESESLVSEGKYYHYMNAYLNLRNSVDRHIKECVGDSANIQSADPDDLRTVNI
jgi:hypothetical protein